jgi:hypothetical protein
MNFDSWMCDVPEEMLSVLGHFVSLWGENTIINLIDLIKINEVERWSALTQSSSKSLSAQLR